MYNPNKPNPKKKQTNKNQIEEEEKTQQQEKIAKPKAYIIDYPGEQYSE